MKEKLFIVSTQYQVLNMLNLINYLNEPCEIDVLILNISNSCSRLQSICAESGFFRHVDLVDIDNLYGKNKFLYYYDRLKIILRISKHIPHPAREYDVVYIVGTEAFSKAIYMHYYQINHSVILEYIEDGTGSYDYILVEPPQKWRNRIFKLLYGFDPRDKCRAMWVYEPKLVDSNYPTINILDLPKIKRNSKFHYLLIKLFAKETPQTYDHKLIFLDSYWGEVHIEQTQKKAVNKMVMHCENDSLLKLHPVSSKNKYGDKMKLIDSPNGMEILVLQNKFQHCTFISVFSTACLLNSFLLGEKDNIIFLYKLIKNNSENLVYFDKFVEKARNNLHCLIFVPETWEQFEKLLLERNNATRSDNE